MCNLFARHTTNIATKQRRGNHKHFGTNNAGVDVLKLKLSTKTASKKFWRPNIFRRTVLQKQSNVSCEHITPKQLKLTLPRLGNSIPGSGANCHLHLDTPVFEP